MNRLDKAFVGIPTFLRTAICTDLDRLDADIAFVGVPSDEGSPFLPGARFAPRTFREHSLRFAFKDGYYDSQLRRKFLEYEMRNGRVVDAGDADIMPTRVLESFDNVTSMLRRILARGTLPVVIGGDHAITFPVVRAFSGPLHVVHFDAHTDYVPFIHTIDGQEDPEHSVTNGHAFRHITRMDHVKSLTQVGIRSIRNKQVEVEDSLRDGNRVVTMNEFLDLSPRGLVESLQLPRNAQCYVSIDIDVLDISLVPGCVSAEPNGMNYAHLRDTLFALTEHVDVVGFDVVEVNPLLDVGTGVTSYLALHLIIEFMSRICDQPGWIARHRDVHLAAIDDVARRAEIAV